MTVCIGVLCEKRQAIVLVADRMVTSGLAIEFEHPVSNKVARLSGTCVALTAGNALATTELIRDVRNATANLVFTGVEEFVEVVKKSFQNLRQRQIVEQVLMPKGFQSFEHFYQMAGRLPEGISISIYSQMESCAYGLQILVAGAGPDGRSHLYQVSDPGTSQCYDSLGFHVIGSGTNLALGNLISGHCHEEMSLPEAILAAVRAKTAAESAPGVGNLTDVTVIFANQMATLSDSQISELKRLAASEVVIARVPADTVTAILWPPAVQDELKAGAQPNKVPAPGATAGHGDPSGAIEVSNVDRDASGGSEVGTNDKVDDVASDAGKN